MIKLSAIKSNPNNPRLIKDDKFKKLVKSLEDFPKMMELRPMVINADSIILGGNMRFKALKELGYKEVPDEWIKRAEDLTEEEQRQFIIKDNVGFGEHDWDMLANEWDAVELEGWGLDIPAFDIGKDLEAEEDDFDATPPEEPKTVLGDLYEIGEHRLLCGDSTCSDTVAKLMNGEKADMVFTDPPYGMDLDTNYADIYTNTISEVKNQSKVIGDEKEIIFLDYYGLFESIKEQFWWGCDYYQNQLPTKGSIFVWDKVCESMEGRIGNEFELCWSKQKHKKEIIHIKWAGFLGLRKEDGKRNHPTQKPVRLCEHFVSNFSKTSNLIIDPFFGSGSTMVASHQLKRKCYGMELDPKYCDVIVNRMIKLDPTIKIKLNGNEIQSSHFD